MLLPAGHMSVRLKLWFICLQAACHQSKVTANFSGPSLLRPAVCSCQPTFYLVKPSGDQFIIHIYYGL
jgi:hypothetical protein